MSQLTLPRGRNADPGTSKSAQISPRVPHFATSTENGKKEAKIKGGELQLANSESSVNLSSVDAKGGKDTDHFAKFKLALKEKWMAKNTKPQEASMSDQDSANIFLDPEYNLPKDLEEELVEQFRNKDYYRQIEGALTNKISLDNPDDPDPLRRKKTKRLDYSNMASSKAIHSSGPSQDSSVVSLQEEGNVKIVIEDTKKKYNKKVREIQIDRENKVKVINDASRDPDFERTLAKYKKHRLKYYLRDFNDIRDKINTMFRKFEKTGEILRWTQEEYDRQLKKIKNFGFIEGSEDNPNHFSTTKELFQQVREDQEREKEEMRREGMAVIEEGYEFTKQIERLRKKRLGEIPDSDEVESDLYPEEEFKNNEFKAIKGMEYLNKKGMARYKYLSKILEETEQKHLNFKNFNKKYQRVLDPRHAVGGDKQVKIARQLSIDFLNDVVTKHQGRSASQSGGDSILNSQTSLANSPDPQARGKQDIIEKIRQRVSLQIMKQQEGKCRMCDRSFSSSSSDSIEGDDSDSSGEGPNYMKFMMSKRQRRAQKEKEDKREKGLKILREYQNQLQLKDDVYTDIKIPMEFVTKFEIEKGFEPGSAKYAPRAVKDEIRIRYLQRQYLALEEFHDQEMKALEIKLRNKMHMYTRACLETMKGELTQEMKLVFVQLDNLKTKEVNDEKKIENLQHKVRIQERAIIELANFCQWDQIAHVQFTEQLERNGLTEDDLMQKNMQQIMVKNMYGLQKYYSGFLHLNKIEKESLDLTKPFQLYGSRIRLSLFEKLNLLERETVMIYQSKLNEMQGELDFIKSQNQDLEQFQEIISQEKIALQILLRREQNELAQLKANWDSNLAEKDRILNETVKKFEKKIAKMNKEADKLHDMFEQELALKDHILDMQKEDNEKLIEKTKELTLKLKVPRQHYEFLQEKGSLEPFIKAMLVGDEISAKWMLQDAARGEIKDLLNYYNDMDTMEKKKNKFRSIKPDRYDKTALIPNKFKKYGSAVYNQVKKEGEKKSKKRTKTKSPEKRAAATTSTHRSIIQSRNQPIQQWNDTTSMGSLSVNFDPAGKKASSVVIHDSNTHQDTFSNEVSLKKPKKIKEEKIKSATKSLTPKSVRHKAPAALRIPERAGHTMTNSPSQSNFDQIKIKKKERKVFRRSSQPSSIEPKSEMNRVNLNLIDINNQLSEALHQKEVVDDRRSSEGRLSKEGQYISQQIYSEHSQQSQIEPEKGQGKGVSQCLPVHNSLQDPRRIQRVEGKRGIGTSIPGKRLARLNELHKKEPLLSDLGIKAGASTDRPKVTEAKTSGYASPFSEEPSVGPKKPQNQSSQYYTIDEQSMNEMFQTSHDGGDSTTLGRPVGTREYINAKKRALIRQQNFQNIKQKVIQFGSQHLLSKPLSINTDLNTSKEDENVVVSDFSQPVTQPAANRSVKYLFKAFGTRQSSTQNSSIMQQQQQQQLQQTKNYSQTASQFFGRPKEPQMRKNCLQAKSKPILNFERINQNKGIYSKFDERKDSRIKSQREATRKQFKMSQLKSSLPNYEQFKKAAQFKQSQGQLSERLDTMRLEKHESTSHDLLLDKQSPKKKISSMNFKISQIDAPAKILSPDLGSNSSKEDGTSPGISPFSRNPHPPNIVVSSRSSKEDHSSSLLNYRKGSSNQVRQVMYGQLSIKKRLVQPEPVPVRKPEEEEEKEEDVKGKSLMQHGLFIQARP